MGVETLCDVAAGLVGDVAETRPTDGGGDHQSLRRRAVHHRRFAHGARTAKEPLGRRRPLRHVDGDVRRDIDHKRGDRSHDEDAAGVDTAAARECRRRLKTASGELDPDTIGATVHEHQDVGVGPVGTDRQRRIAVGVGRPVRRGGAVERELDRRSRRRALNHDRLRRGGAGAQNRAECDGERQSSPRPMKGDFVAKGHCHRLWFSHDRAVMRSTRTAVVFDLNGGDLRAGRSRAAGPDCPPRAAAPSGVEAAPSSARTAPRVREAHADRPSPDSR